MRGDRYDRFMEKHGFKLIRNDDEMVSYILPAGEDDLSVIIEIDLAGDLIRIYGISNFAEGFKPAVEVNRKIVSKASRKAVKARRDLTLRRIRRKVENRCMGLIRAYRGILERLFSKSSENE